MKYLSIFESNEVISVIQYNNVYYCLYDEIIFNYNKEEIVNDESECNRIKIHVYFNNKSQIDIYSIIHI